MEDENQLRSDPELAREIMEDACPNNVHRRVVLGQLLASIEVAESFAPESWAVTLFTTGFRLNIGPVEAYTYFDGIARVLLHGNVTPPTKGEVHPIEYKSVPSPQTVFVGADDVIEGVLPEILPAHREFIRFAAIGPKGTPRRARFAYKNSPGLIEYARSFIEVELSEI